MQHVIIQKDHLAVPVTNSERVQGNGLQCSGKNVQAFFKVAFKISLPELLRNYI